jgi:hypothetical protein
MGRPETHLRVDHLVYATPDLAAGTARIAGLLGVVPAAGGRHTGRGTRNALVRLGPRTYLEVVGPDSGQPSPRQPRWFGIDSLRESRIVTWAASTIAIDALAARAARAGVSLGPVATGRRTRADGVELVWRFTDPAAGACDGIVPFLIDWGTTPHPAATAPDGGALVALRAEHPDPSSVERCLRGLDLDMVVARGDAPALIATIRTRTGDVELR